MRQEIVDQLTTLIQRLSPKRLESYYSKNNRETAIKWQLTRMTELKNKVFDILGRKCVKCGFDDWRALQVDHIFNDGWADISPTSKKRRTGLNIYYQIVRSPEEAKKIYQILCANCNHIKEMERRRFMDRDQIVRMNQSIWVSPTFEVVSMET
jgi:hypothetical protein